MENYSPKIGKGKKSAVESLKEKIRKYPIVATIDMENLPTPQLQRMRATIREKMDLVMTKKRLMKLALEGLEKEKPGITKLIPKLRGMPALLFTEENPFTLFKTLKKNKSNAPAKAGQTAPNDIYVDAGPTNFAPGPIIGELGSLGIKTSVENGKLAIKEKIKVFSEGDVIDAKAAELLTRLGIEPMEVGLNLTACYENGEILDKTILDIDEDKYYQNLVMLASESFNISLEIGYATKETIKPMIAKAYREADILAFEQDIITGDNVEDIMAKAERQAHALKQATN